MSTTSRIILDGLRRMLRSAFDVETAPGPESGLSRLAEKPAAFAVVMSDFQMPRMNGAKFLAAARSLAPDTSRVLLTGHADLAGAASVVNEGGILRLLLKPASREEVVEALSAGAEHHRLVCAERELLDSTLRGSVRALTEVLALANPSVFARSTRVRDLVSRVTTVVAGEVSWDVELAAMLADIGAIALPAGVFERAQRGQRLEPAAEQMMASLPTIADQVLSGIPRIEAVRAAILSQAAYFNGNSSTDPRSGERIPFGGRVLRVVRDFGSLEMLGIDSAEALSTLRARKGRYDPTLLDALASVLADRVIREIRASRSRSWPPEWCWPVMSIP